MFDFDSDDEQALSKFVPFDNEEVRPKGFKTRPCATKGCKDCHRGYHGYHDEHKAYPLWHYKAKICYWKVFPRTAARDLALQLYNEWLQSHTAELTQLDMWKIEECTIEGHSNWKMAQAQLCTKYHLHLGDMNHGAIIRNREREEAMRRRLEELEWERLDQQARAEKEREALELANRIKEDEEERNALRRREEEQAASREAWIKREAEANVSAIKLEDAVETNRRKRTRKRSKKEARVTPNTPVKWE